MGHDVQRHVDVGLIQDLFADVGLQRSEGERVQQHGYVELLFREVRQNLVALFFIGRIDVEVQRLAPEPLDVAADLGDVLHARLAVQVDAHDIIASLRQRPGRPLPEPARGTQDERPLRSLYLRVCDVWHGDIIADIR